MLNVITINIIYTLDDIETNYIWVNGKNAFLHSICSLNRFVLLSNDPYELNWTELKRHLTLIRHSFETIHLSLMKLFNLKMYLHSFHSVHLEFMFFFYFSSKLSIISRICVRAYSLDWSYQMRISIFLIGSRYQIQTMTISFFCSRENQISAIKLASKSTLK